MRPNFWAGKIVLFTAMGMIAFGFFGGAVMLLWNNVLVNVINVHIISFWQALGILVLSKILFGGFFSGRGRRFGNWRLRMHDKWNNMTPEEQEKFRQQWYGRCGWGSRYWHAETKGQQADTPTSH
jgi:Ca2+/H+ antiporter, TMEM165/GDT1 family